MEWLVVNGTTKYSERWAGSLGVRREIRKITIVTPDVLGSFHATRIIINVRKQNHGNRWSDFGSSALWNDRQKSPQWGREGEKK